MSEYFGLLEFLKQQQEEAKLQQFLEKKGYANSQCENFGLNQWTNHLVSRKPDVKEEIHNRPEVPDHFVSFLSVPDCWQNECLDTNAEEFQRWVSEYKWKNIPGLSYSPLQGKVQACSEGLILPQWIDSPSQGDLEAFLLIRRDGICEYGMGKNAYYFYERNTTFQFIHIIGRLWQFLYFMIDLQETFLKEKNPEARVIINLRGTQNALLGNLAERWNEPLPHSLSPFYPRCMDNHLQIQRRISPVNTEKELDVIIRWFATRIDNAWGQFEPRCYVSKQLDETTPFAFLKRK